MLRCHSSRHKQRRPLGRSKSASCIRPDPVRYLQSIEPEIARRDARIAALLSFHQPNIRALTSSGSSMQSESPRSRGIDVTRRSRSHLDGSLSKMAAQDGSPEATNQRSIRFAGPPAQSKRHLGRRVAESKSDAVLSASQRSGIDPPSGSIQYGEALPMQTNETSEFARQYLNTLGLPPDQIHREYHTTAAQKPRGHLRKSKSMFSSLGSRSMRMPSETASVRSKRWFGSLRRSSSSRGEVPNFTRGALSIRSLRFTEPQIREEPTAFDFSHQPAKDPVIQLAREKFYEQQADLEQQAKFQSSLISNSETNSYKSSGFRKSLRNSSNNSNSLSSAFSFESTSTKKAHSLRRAARKVSSSFKNTFKGMFHSKIRETYILETPSSPLVHTQYFDTPEPEYEMHTTLGTGYLGSELIKHQQPAQAPSIHEAGSNQKIRSHRGSVEKLTPQNDCIGDNASRVTSWTDSMASTEKSHDIPLEYERKRLSVIDENGLHISSAKPGVVKPVVDSQRVYSALMKRFQEVKVKEEAESEPGVQSFRNCSSLTLGGHSTIRTVCDNDDDVFVARDNDGEQSASGTNYSQNNQLGNMVDGTRVEPKTVINDIKLQRESENSLRIEPPVPISQRSSAFFASPTSHLFRTTSPYRRALQESMKASPSHFESQSQTSRKHLYSLSNPSLPMPDSSSKDLHSEKLENPWSCSSSNYSFDMQKHKDEDAKSTPGQSKISLFPAVANNSFSARKISIASSVGWKTQLSAHVAKAEEERIANRDKEDLSPSTYPKIIGHVREPAEIDAQGETLQPASYDSNPFNALPTSSRVITTHVQPINIYDENTAPTSSNNMQSQMDTTRADTTKRVTLATKAPQVYQNSDNSNFTPGKGRGLQNFPPARVPDTNESVKSSPGLTAAVERQFGKAMSGSPQERHRLSNRFS